MISGCASRPQPARQLSKLSSPSLCSKVSTSDILWHICLMYCAKTLTFAGSNPDEVIGIFHWLNPSDRTLALGLAVAVTEISTRDVFWRERRPVCRIDKPAPYMCQFTKILVALTSWSLRVCPGLYRDSYHHFIIYVYQSLACSLHL